MAAGWVVCCLSRAGRARRCLINRTGNTYQNARTASFTAQ